MEMENPPGTSNSNGADVDDENVSFIGKKRGLDSDNGEELGFSLSKKAKNGGGLERVAEIVLVLSAMAGIRGGKSPTETEVKLMEEARIKLTEICQDFKPRDLVTSNSVTSLIDDLGLNRKLKEQRLGHFRNNSVDSRLSIKDRADGVKRKMEETKKFTIQSGAYTSPVPQPSFGSMSDIRGPSHSMRMFPPNTPLSSGGLPAASSSGHVSASLSTSATHHSVTEVRASTVSPGIPNSYLGRDSSVLSGPKVERPHFKAEVVPNGTSYAAQVQANISANQPSANAQPNQPWSLQSHSLSTMKATPENKLLNHGTMKAEGTRPQIAQSPSANFPSVHQPMQGDKYVQPPSMFNNHHDIGKIVQKLLHPKLPEPPTWTPPSRDYMNKPLPCQMCKFASNDVEAVVICDACEKGFHLKCLETVNQKGIPRGGEWHCLRCIALSNGKPLPPKYGRVMRSITPCKGVSNPAGVQPLNPSVSQVSNPAGAQVSNPAGAQVSNPAGAQLSNPAGAQLSNPAGAQPSNPAGVLLSYPAGSQPSMEKKSETVDQIVNPEKKSETVNPMVNLEKKSETIDQRVNQEKKIEILDQKVNQGKVLTNGSSDLQSRTVSGAVSNSCAASDLKTMNSGEMTGNNITSSVEDIDQGTSSGDAPNTSGKSLGTLSDSPSNGIITIQPTQASESCAQDERPLSGSNLQSAALSSGIISNDTEISKSSNDLQQTDQGGLSISGTGELPMKTGQESFVAKELDITKGNSDGTSTVDVNQQSGQDAAHANSIGSSEANGEARKFDAMSSDGVQWTGNVLKVSDGKTFYESCSVDGVTYRVQDHALFRASNEKLIPSKLKEMWEDTETGLKWVTASQCYFPGDLPETVGHPCAPDSKEVYESNHENIINIGLIQGPCEVLHPTKFQEKDKRLSELGTVGENGSLPVFLCRWFYDETKGNFQQVFT